MHDGTDYVLYSEDDASQECFQYLIAYMWLRVVAERSCTWYKRLFNLGFAGRHRKDVITRLLTFRFRSIHALPAGN